MILGAETPEPIITLGSPETMLPPCAVILPIVATGTPLINTVGSPCAIRLSKFSATKYSDLFPENPLQNKLQHTDTMSFKQELLIIMLGWRRWYTSSQT